LRAAGCSGRNFYREKVTGARADRRELNRMLGKLAPDDVVTVTRIDRLARSTFDLFGIVKRIVDAKADLIRTRTAEGRSRAKAQGRHMGRPPTLSSRSQKKEAMQRRAQGGTLKELADSYNVGISTIRRATREP
jgi:DNA invertase Pin-like site-specific DNA recombinase